MYVANCGGLKYNPTDFTVIDRVLTSATQPKDVYTPTYSTGVTAKFNEEVYAEEVGKETTTYTATVADSVTTWSDGTDTVTMADVGITDIAGAVDGSTIKITYSIGSEPRTALVGDAFKAHHCGGILLDDGVFEEDKVDGKYVVTLVGETASAYLIANCSILFDKAKFELDNNKALSLVTE